MLALVLGGAAHADAAGSTPEHWAERSAAVETFVEQFVAFAMFDGTILIDIGGEVVFEQSFGYAHSEHAVRHDVRTRFRIASVSKALTDAAVARLIDGGVFGRTTPISRFLPDFPSAERITIGHLLDHSSGVPHTNDQPWGDGSVSLSIDEIVLRLAELPLDFEPGSDRAYSNGGYAVLAKVLMVAGGGSYAEVMRRIVFEPLGMHDTDHIADARKPIVRMATGYEPGARIGERRHARDYAVETRPGGGSLYSTARDLLRFARATFRDDFIPPEQRRDVLGADDVAFLSQGRSPGFVAKLYYEAERDIIVISLSNNYAVPAGWAARLADLATGAGAVESWPRLEAVGPIPVAADDPRLGRYRLSRGGAEVALVRGPAGDLTMTGIGDERATAMIPLAGGGFLQPQYFQRCEQESVTRVITCRVLSGDERYTTRLTPVSK